MPKKGGGIFGGRFDTPMHIMGGLVESGEGVVKVVADNNLAFEQIEIIINHFSIQGSPKIH